MNLEEEYQKIVYYYNLYLKDKGVILPKLKINNKYTKDALVLIKVFEGYPNTNIISKDELTKFIQQFYPNVTDVQQARHLAMQKGWYIASGSRGDNNNLKNGEYKLITLEESYPGFIKDRRTGLSNDDFEEIKKQYNYRCACCGSKEGEPHFHHKNVIVQLQQGHMDPTKDLVKGNIIPQCQICNRPDKNRWVYDSFGRVIDIANTSEGHRIIKNFISKLSDTDKQEIKRMLND